MSEATKLDGNSLTRKIAQIVKEEIGMMREAEHGAFQKLGNANRRKDFAKWVMRQYFNPEKNKNSIWFDPDVTEKSLFDYISNPRNSFPLSPIQIVKFYNDMKGLQGMMKSSEVEKSLEDTDLDDEEEQTRKYRQGATSLKDIGAAVGGLSATMINKIEASSAEKMQQLTGGKHPKDLSPEEEKELYKKLEAAEIEAANKFADMLIDARGNIGKFLAALHKNQILSPAESRQMSDNEVEALLMLGDESRDRIIKVLRKDLNDPRGNVVKSFQSMYSKTIFPPKKRGRPRKNPS